MILCNFVFIEEEISLKNDSDKEDLTNFNKFEKKQSINLKDVETLFKKCFDKILAFTKQNEAQEIVSSEINSLLKEGSKLLDKILIKSNEDETILMDTLTNNVGKYMHIILKLLEENNNFIKGLCFLDATVKNLQEIMGKIKNKIFIKVPLIFFLNKKITF